LGKQSAGGNFIAAFWQLSCQVILHSCDNQRCCKRFTVLGMPRTPNQAGFSHTTSDQLRFAVVPRKQIPELKKKKLSNRTIAKMTGVSPMTVGRDLAVTNGTKNVPNVTPPTVGEFETIVIDPPWPMVKIERDARLNQAGFGHNKGLSKWTVKTILTAAATRAAILPRPRTRQAGQM
jgi:hypothetical protein